MDTAEIALLFFYIVILAMAATVAALTIVYIRRLQSSKGTRELKSEGDQGEESALEEKAERQLVPESSSGRAIHKQAISSGKKPLEPKPAAIELPPEAQETRQAASSEGMEQSPRMKGITFVTRNKADEEKQAHHRKTGPVESSEPRVAPKDDSVSHTLLDGAPQGQLVITELKSGKEPAHESSPGNTSPAGERNKAADITEPAQIVEEREDSMEDTIHHTDVNKTSSEPPAETVDSDKANQEMPQAQKSSMGDLSDLFAKSNVEDTRANKLAEEMNDVDINELLQEGLGLLGKLKKFDR